MKCIYCNKMILESNLLNYEEHTYCSHQCKKKGIKYFEKINDKNKYIKLIIFITLLILLMLNEFIFKTIFLNIIILPIAAYYFFQNIELNFIIKYIGIKNSKILSAFFILILLLRDFIKIIYKN